MKAVQDKILNYLSKHKEFVIPIYQRNYAWDKNDCAQMWDDIWRCTTDDTIQNYFFGTIICFVEGDKSAGIGKNTQLEKMYVIDGQQRITTFSLLLLAMYRKLQNKKIDKALFKEQARDQNKKLKEYKKLTQVHLHNQAYEELIDYGKCSIESTNIVKNYQYFVERIDEIYELDNTNIAKIINVLENKVDIVSMFLGSNDDPQSVYEKINSTGKNLLESDKIRNYIFMSIDKDKHKEYYDNYWNDIEKNTNNKEHDIEDFFLKYVSYKYAVDIKKNDLFYKFKEKHSDDRNKNIESFLSELKAFSRYYYICGYLDKPLRPEEENKYGCIKEYSDFLLRKGQTTQITYFMSLLKLYDSEKIDKKELKNAFKFIRNYYVQREILHIQHQGYNKEYSKLHKEIDNIMSDDKKLDYIQALCVKFFERMSPAKKIKREEVFREDILSTNFYRMNISFLVDIANNRQNDVRIEYNDVAKNGSVEKKYTVEHILPQTISNSNELNQKKWQESIGQDNWEKVHLSHVHTLGNLTILTTQDNSSASNGIFSEKKEIYGDSDIKITKNIGGVKIAECGEEIWNDKAIVKRTKDLINDILDLWGTREFETIYDTYKENNDKKTKKYSP